MSFGARWIGAACAALMLAGCATSPVSRFYTLDSPVPPGSGVTVASPAAAGPQAATPARGPLAVTVGPVAIPAVVDRPEMVITVGPNEVWLDEFNRWAGPLADAIGLAVAGHLAVLLPSSDVTLLAQSAGGPADTRVAIEVQRFESVPGSHALIDAVFTVRGAGTGRVHTARTTAREATADRSHDALAAAHSRAVARLARDIAAAIAAVTSTPPGTSPPR